MVKTIVTFLSSATLIITIVISLLMPLSWVKKQVNTETYHIQKTLGTESFKTFERDIYEMYNYLIYETGVFNGVSQVFEKVNIDLVKNIGKNFEYLIFQVVQRALLIKYWLPFFVVLIGVLFVDGLGRREIKKYSYGFSDLKLFHLSMHMLTISLAVFVLYLGIPITISVTVWVPFLIFGFMAYWVHLLVSNYQKV